MVGTPTNKYYTKPKSKFRFCFSYLNVLFSIRKLVKAAS